MMLTSIGDDDIELTRFLLDVLGSSLVILLVPRVEPHGMNVGILGRQVFEGLSGGVTGTCEDDGVGAFGDGASETETNTAVSTGDYAIDMQ